jgi:GntR family transcriptional regulator
MDILREDRRPLAMRLRDRMWSMLQEECYRTGDKLPSEGDLAARFRVSRATVREALKILEEERVILCRHGVGRFLAPDPSSVLSEDITRLKSVTEISRGLGIPITTQVLSLYEEPARDIVRARLSLEPDSTVIVLERIRLAHGEAIIYSVDIFPTKLVTGELHPKEFAGSLLSVMEEKWDTRLAYSKTVLSAVVLDSELGRRVGVADGVPWILMEQVNYDAQDRPILYSTDYHRGDKFQFRVLRRRR